MPTSIALIGLLALRLDLVVDIAPLIASVADWLLCVASKLDRAAVNALHRVHLVRFLDADFRLEDWCACSCLLGQLRDFLLETTLVGLHLADLVLLDEDLMVQLGFVFISCDHLLLDFLQVPQRRVQLVLSIGVLVLKGLKPFLDLFILDSFLVDDLFE